MIFCRPSPESTSALKSSSRSAFSVSITRIGIIVGIAVEFKNRLQDLLLDAISFAQADLDRGIGVYPLHTPHHRRHHVVDVDRVLHFFAIAPDFRIGSHRSTIEI